MSKRKRSANAYFRYRSSRIYKRKLRMTECSKITSEEWKSVDDSQKCKFYQEYAKDLVMKEADSGGNGLTVKTYEQYGNIAFVRETPIPKKKTNAVGKKVLSQIKRVMVQAPSISFEGERNLNNNQTNAHSYYAEFGGEVVLHDQEDWFQKYTVGTDFAKY
ncbi:8276_t:CDS:1 [Funneliformis mosseae]|uniref:8276_t:CDS:1 n=1 Tax=Funneliformis mosseae TaxID=27381 RepID=A0A9N9ABN4_FUNMO|nr:8276_t:CDS:1 [Funneliformis mosseae]